MSEADYEYRGLLARSWDLMRGDPAEFPDRQFIRNFVAGSGEPILDVGCGTGRFLLEFLADGWDVDGLDVSPEMLAICQQKAKQQGLNATLYEQAMESMALPRRYQTIIVPSASFQLVPDLGDAEKALDRFYEHLLPGGSLIMSIWHITKAGTGEWNDWWLVAEKEGFEEDKRIKRWERSRYDASSQLRYTENRYELWQDGEIVFTEMHRRSPELRNYSVGQLTAMLEEAGFADVRAFSGFTDDPATEEDDTFTIVGVRK